MFCFLILNASPFTPQRFGWILTLKFYSTLGSEINSSKGKYSYLKVISKGNHSKYFKHLWNAGSVLNLRNAKMSRQSLCHIAHYFSPDWHTYVDIYIQQSSAIFKQMKVIFQLLHASFKNLKWDVSSFHYG